MAKYIKCSGCGRKIPFGQLICMERDDDSGDAYCGPQCLVNSYGGMLRLTEDQADYWDFKVYDDDKRKKEIEEQMAKLQRELELLTAQN